MSNILTGFNMQGNDPIDDRIVSKSNLETLEQYLKRVPVQKRYYGLTFFALDKNNELRKYTFQTSLIEPTIDDDEEEIERIDKELQEHVSNKAIHKTSEEIRSEIVDADIPDTIARVQWTLDQINTAVINLIGGASDEYNTLKRIQTKIEELRAEMESQLYGDDGGEVLKTLEQALKFLNQYKDFIVDIPDNFVSKQDIVDNLTTDDPTKVLSAKQGKILSDTLTNYFESAMQSIRTETDRAINAENRIEAKLDKEIERSTNEDIRIDNKLDSEINRSTAEDDRLDKKIDAETTRATTAESNLNTKIETETTRAEGEESRIETKLDNEITRSTNKDTEHDNRLQALEGQTHEQNTDLGTTNSTFQLKYNTGNKIKHESDAISVRNAADTDYVNFIAKNATFKGDLLVEGQSFVTEAETVEIKDNLLLLNKGEVGAGVTKGIAGLEIDRGTEPNYQIIFDESDNRFKAGEIGDIQCLALRDGDDSMVNGMFTTWDSTTKRLKTTNIVPSSSFLYFGDNKTVSLNYSPANDGSLTINTNNQYLAIFTGDNYTNFRSTRNKFQFIGDLYTTGTKYALTFKRGSDNSEVLYHADIINNLTSGGTNKVLSAEQGKLLQNSITSIQGSYLPLSGGTMTGSINLPSTDPLKMIISGSVDSVLSYWPSNNAIEFGNNKRKIFLRTDNSNIIHYINGSSYSIYDAYNLPDPVTLSGNNTFTGNNTFQAGKFNVGPFEVTSSGSLFLDISSQAESAWSRSITFRANSDPTSGFIFGGFNLINDTSIGYAYIGIGDVGHNTAQYKFYSNQFSVSSTMVVPESSFRIFTGNSTLFYHNQSEKKVKFGNSDSSVSLELMAKNLYHSKYDTASSTWKNYIIYSEYNLPNPVTYIADGNNYATLTNKDGQYFTYIKAGTNGLLPHSKATLTSGGSGSIGTSDQGFNAAYINNLHTNKVTFGDAGSFIDNQSGDSSHIGIGFYTSQNAACPVYVGSLCVSDGYANSAPNIPTNGIYSKGNIRTSGWISFTNNAWTDEGGAYKEEDGSLKVLIVPTDSSQPKPSTYGSVLQFNSRKNHWCTQIWSDQVNSTANPSNGKLRYRTTQSYATTTWNPWTVIATEDYVSSNYLPLTGGTISSSKSNPLTINSTHASQSSIDFSRGGVNKGTVGFYESLGSFLQNSTGETLAVKSDGAYYGANTNSLRKLATVTDLNNYLPLTGGALSGTLTINTVGDQTLIINNNDTNGIETFVRVLRKGTPQAAIGFCDGLGAYVYNYNADKYLFIDNDGYARVGTTSGSTRLALITDIPSISGYLPLSGGTMSGNISFNGNTGHIVVGAKEISNYVNAISFNKGSATNSAYIGYHSTGGSDSSGALILVPYSTSADPWAKTVGLYIAKNKLLLDGKQIATTDQIPSIPSISISNSGSGNAVTSITASGHTLTVTKGATYLTSHQTIYNLTFQAGTFAAKTFDPNGAAATVNIPTKTSHITNDSGFITSSALSGYATQEWVNGQGFLTSDSLLDKFVPTTGGYIRNSDQVLLRLQRTGVSTGTRRTIEMYFDDSNTDGTSTTPRGSIGYDSEAGMFLYSAASKKFLAIENTGKPFYGTPENRYYLLGSNTQHHNLDGYQRIGDIMIQWGYFTVQGNSTRAVNFPVSFTNTVWSVTGSWDNTIVSNQENWGFTDYTSSGFTIINGDGSSRVFHYIAIGPFTRS